MTRRLIPTAFAGLALVFLAAGVFEVQVQQRQDEYVRAVTREVLEGVPAQDFDARVVALRDYVRTHVRNIEFRGLLVRPFLRDTAADTLRSGKGRCGEAARVFVNMARAAGIPAQRLYLEGEQAHVISVVGREDGAVLIVDAVEPAYFTDLEPLSALTSHKEFRTYSTWRRTRALRALPSNFVSLGPLAYIFENPHAFISCLCFLASAAMLTLAAYAKQRLPRRIRTWWKVGLTTETQRHS